MALKGSRNVQGARGKGIAQAEGGGTDSGSNHGAKTHAGAPAPISDRKPERGLNGNGGPFSARELHDSA